MPKQLDVLISEWLEILAVNADDPDQHIIFEHRNEKCAAIASKLDNSNCAGIATVSPLCLNVGDLHRPLGSGRAVEPGSRTRAQYRFAPSLLRKSRRSIMLRSDSKGVTFAQIQRAELRLADTHRGTQHGREHWLQLTGRAANDAEHLRGRRLLLLRLGKLPLCLVSAMLCLSKLARTGFELLLQSCD